MPEAQMSLRRYLTEGSKIIQKELTYRRVDTGKRVIPCREGEIH
jgi:hypothetical protein